MTIDLKFKNVTWAPCSFCLFTNCTVESRFFSWSLALKGIACWRVTEGCRAESCGCVIRTHALPATSQESTDCAAKKVFHATEMPCWVLQFYVTCASISSHKRSFPNHSYIYIHISANAARPLYSSLGFSQFTQSPLEFPIFEIILSVYSQVLPEFSTSFFSLFKSAPLHQFSLEKPKAASCCQHHIAAVWRTCQTPWQSTWRPRCIDLLLGVERTFESDTFEHVEGKADKVAEQRMCWHVSMYHVAIMRSHVLHINLSLMYRNSHVSQRLSKLSKMWLNAFQETPNSGSNSEDLLSSSSLNQGTTAPHRR